MRVACTLKIHESSSKIIYSKAARLFNNSHYAGIHSFIHFPHIMGICMYVYSTLAIRIIIKRFVNQNNVCW